MSDVVLRIDGINLSGWTGFQIVRSMEQALHTFSVSLTELVSQETLKELPVIQIGSLVEVFLLDELLITGYIDTVAPSYDSESHSVAIAGRSRGVDLVDCGLSGKEFKEQNLLQLAEAVCKPYSIKVFKDTDIGATFPVARIEPGQTGFQFLEGLARQRAVRIISDAQGHLHIINLGKTVISNTLELGVNILKGTTTRTQKNRFFKVTVGGQQPSSSWNNAEVSAIQKAESFDKNIRRTREHFLIAETSSDTDACQKRADWHRNTAYGRSETTNYTVKGWWHSQGLWQPNTQVGVFDKWSGHNGEKLLIVSVTFSLNDEGETTELVLMPPEALELLPVKPKGRSVTKAWAANG